MKNYNSSSSRNKYKGENSSYNNGYSGYNYYNNYYYNNNLSYYKKKNSIYGKGVYYNEYTKEKDKNNKNSDISLHKKYDDKKNEIEQELNEIDQIKNDSVLEEVDKINNITFGNDDNLDCDFSYIMSNNLIENEKKIFKLNKLENKNLNCSEFSKLEENNDNLLDDSSTDFIKMGENKRKEHFFKYENEINYNERNRKKGTQNDNIIHSNNKNAEKKMFSKNNKVSKENDDLFQFDNKVSNLTEFINKNIFYSNENDELNDGQSSGNGDPFNFMNFDTTNEGFKDLRELKKDYRNNKNIINVTHENEENGKKNYVKKKVNSEEEDEEITEKKEKRLDECKLSENEFTRMHLLSSYEQIHDNRTYNNENYKDVDYFSCLKKKNMNITGYNKRWKDESNDIDSDNINEKSSGSNNNNRSKYNSRSTSNNNDSNNNISGNGKTLLEQNYSEHARILTLNMMNNMDNIFSASGINELVESKNFVADEKLDLLNEVRNVYSDMNHLKGMNDKNGMNDMDDINSMNDMKCTKRMKDKKDINNMREMNGVNNVEVYEVKHMRNQNDINSILESSYINGGTGINENYVVTSNKYPRNNVNNFKLKDNDINETFLLHINEKKDIPYKNRVNYNLNNSNNKYNGISEGLKNYREEEYSNENCISQEHMIRKNEEEGKTKYFVCNINNDDKDTDLRELKYNKEILHDERILSNADNFLLRNHFEDENYYINLNSKLNNFTEDDLLYLKDEENIKLNAEEDMNVLNILNEYYLGAKSTNFMLMGKNKEIFADEDQNVESKNNIPDGISKPHTNNDRSYVKNYGQGKDSGYDHGCDRRYDSNEHEDAHYYSSKQGGIDIHIETVTPHKGNNVYVNSGKTIDGVPMRETHVKDARVRGPRLSDPHLSDSRVSGNNKSIQNEEGNSTKARNIMPNYGSGTNNIRLSKNLDTNNFSKKNYIGVYKNNIKDRPSRSTPNVYIEKHEQREYFHRNSERGANHNELHAGNYCMAAPDGSNNSNYNSSGNYNINGIINHNYNYFTNDKTHAYSGKSVNGNDFYKAAFERSVVSNENYVTKLRKQNMLKLTKFLKTSYMNMHIKQINEKLYHYYRFINKISANIKKHKYHIKYKNIMQKSDKDKLLRIQLSYMIINPCIQKNSGKWNFKNEEKGDKENINTLLNQDTALNHDSLLNMNKSEKTLIPHFDKNKISTHTMNNSEGVFKDLPSNKYQKILNSYKSENEEEHVQNDDHMENDEPMQNSETLLLLEKLKQNYFLNQDFSILYPSGKDDKLDALLDERNFDMSNENFLNINLNKILNFSTLSEDNLKDHENEALRGGEPNERYTENTYVDDNAKMFLQMCKKRGISEENNQGDAYNEAGDKNEESREEEEEAGEGGHKEEKQNKKKLDNNNDDETKTRYKNDDYENSLYMVNGGENICKYENIKKLGRYVFATVHEPRNLITLVKMKDTEGTDEIIDKIKFIIKSEVGDDIVEEDEQEVGISANEINTKGYHQQKESRYSLDKRRNSYLITSNINSNMKNNMIKKILEVIWDLYIDIKNLYKDIDKCPYTHIGTISKYNEDIKRKKNTLFNFIFLNKINDNTQMVYSYADNNNIFLKKNITNVDIIMNKYVYLYITNTLYSNIITSTNIDHFSFPNIEDLITSLTFDQKFVSRCVRRSYEGIAGGGKNGLCQGKGDKVDRCDISDNADKTDKAGKNHLSTVSNESNIGNIFLYPFPYENNEVKLSSFDIFGKTIMFNCKYSYYNFENYNNYDCFNKMMVPKEKKKKSFFLFKEKENRKGTSQSTEADNILLVDSLKIHNDIEICEMDKNQIKNDLCRLRSVYYLFVKSILKNKGAYIYKKIFKIIKKKKRMSLIYTLFSNYLLMFYIFSQVDECFDSKFEYEEFLKLQLLHINTNINTINKLLKNEKAQNKPLLQQEQNLNNPQQRQNIRYKLYNANVYTSLYIYLIDITLSYLFTPDIGIKFFQNILSLILFYNYINLYITKILFYKSGAGLLTILLVKIIPYVKEFDRNLIICFLYSVLNSMFYILSNIFYYHLNNEKKKKKYIGNESELYSKILTSMTNEIDFYKIVYKSVCSYSHQERFYEDEIAYMLQDLGKDDIVKVIMNHIKT
ncbi:conserved Plasmodium protein, unknown function [Plasmodium malariae]|uniref:Uncharacterized protein n=1 Tax=Plasmodium malariae TaxID=5858 RepID=A0A1C3KFE2_PLAMA|nr:conserved Plasmodium protein, unknown function [Plasmodium malariae]